MVVEKFLQDIVDRQRDTIEDLQINLGDIKYKIKKLMRFLDDCIDYWRRKKEISKTKQDKLITECYIDAYQSVKISIFGKQENEKNR